MICSDYDGVDSDYEGEVEIISVDDRLLLSAPTNPPIRIICSD